MPTPIPPHQEAKLLQQVATGHESSYTQLYYTYAAQLKRYLDKTTSLSREDQEDIIQEVFIAVWEKRKTLTGLSSFKGYLFIVTRNRVINTYSRESKRRQVFQHLSFSQPYVYDGLEEDLLYRFYVKKVAEAIRLLPEKVRMVFEVSSAHLITAMEIGRLLKISVHMVRKHIRQANTFIISYLRKKAGWLITGIGPFLLFIF